MNMTSIVIGQATRIFSISSTYFFNEKSKRAQTCPNSVIKHQFVSMWFYVHFSLSTQFHHLPHTYIITSSDCHRQPFLFLILAAFCAASVPNFHFCSFLIIIINQLLSALEHSRLSRLNCLFAAAAVCLPSAAICPIQSIHISRHFKLTDWLVGSRRFVASFLAECQK